MWLWCDFKVKVNRRTERPLANNQSSPARVRRRTFKRRNVIYCYVYCWCGFNINIINLYQLVPTVLVSGLHQSSSECLDSTKNKIQVGNTCKKINKYCTSINKDKTWDAVVWKCVLNHPNATRCQGHVAPPLAHTCWDVEQSSRFDK